MYSKRTVYDAHLTSKKHLMAAERMATAKSAPNGTSNSNGPAQNGSHTAHAPPNSKQKHRAMALKETMIKRLINSPTSPLVSILSDTKSNVERKQALTDKERQQELEEMEAREHKEAEEAAAASAADGQKNAGEEEEVGLTATLGC